MPLDATALGRIFKSALGALSDRAAEHRPYQLALLINRRYNLNPEEHGYTSEQGLFNAVWNVVRQAASSYAAGRALQSSTDTPITPPRVPGITDLQPEFSYRVVAEIRLPDGHRLTTSYNVRDDRPLSMNELRQSALEQLANSTYQYGETLGRERVQAEMHSYPVNIYVISAGRR